MTRDPPRGLEHDPEKWIPVFGKRSCSNKELERDDVSKKGHPALARALARRACGAALVILIAWIAFETAILCTAAPDLARADKVSTVITAEDGQILKAYLSDDGFWRLRTGREDVPPHYLDMLLAYEDKRFFSHGGVDLLAAGRAFFELVKHRRVISGASTLTMQTVRLLHKQEPGLLGKLRQALLAIKLERQLDKQSILALYLTLAPFGGNIEGVRAASLRHFGKEPMAMSIAEAALLVALPQSPERRRPGLASSMARSSRDFVLRRMAARGVLDAVTVAQAMRERVASQRETVFLAPHLSDRLRAENPAAAAIATHIDRHLQARVEALAAEFVARQADTVNIAMLVLRNRDLAARAYVGGGNYFDADRAGMVDLVRAVRSPGSALKPIIYGFAFEDLTVHPDTIVRDDAFRLEGYAPENFDKKYHGDLLIRDALLLSVNTVPVLLLDQIGADRFLSRMRGAGIALDLPPARDPPGLAVALGGVGLSLEGLARLYAGIANGGRVGPVRLQVDAPRGSSATLISSEAAWAVADILADAPPPIGRTALRSRDGGRRVAYKTGTSYGFRDAWAVGFDSDHVVAVWIGRPDGMARLGETASAIALPIMRAIFDLLPAPARAVAAERPRHSLLAHASDLPERLKYFAPRSTGRAHAFLHRSFEIRFPIDGSAVKLVRHGTAPMPLTISAAGGNPPFRWYIDGKPMQNPPHDHKMIWTPEERGQVEIVIVDSQNKRASSRVWLD